MTWEELIYQLNGIPEHRRNEKAVFVVDGSDAWEIDAVNLNPDEDDYADGEDMHEVLQANSIFDDESQLDHPPIILTP